MKRAETITMEDKNLSSSDLATSPSLGRAKKRKTVINVSKVTSISSTFFELLATNFTPYRSDQRKIAQYNKKRVMGNPTTIETPAKAIKTDINPKTKFFKVYIFYPPQN